MNNFKIVSKARNNSNSKNLKDILTLSQTRTIKAKYIYLLHYFAYFVEFVFTKNILY